MSESGLCIVPFFFGFVEKVENESEDKADELADDTGKDKTEAVDA